MQNEKWALLLPFGCGRNLIGQKGWTRKNLLNFHLRGDGGGLNRIGGSLISRRLGDSGGGGGGWAMLPGPTSLLKHNSYNDDPSVFTLQYNTNYLADTFYRVRLTMSVFNHETIAQKSKGSRAYIRFIKYANRTGAFSFFFICVPQLDLPPI